MHSAQVAIAALAAVALLEILALGFVIRLHAKQLDKLHELLRASSLGDYAHAQQVLANAKALSKPVKNAPLDPYTDALKGEE